MSLTPEQRAEVSRQNGKKSRGPVTDEGKARSRQNSLKHGCRATILALPSEDPETIDARAASWNDYYNPQSPAAQHLVTECVRATLLADRVHTAHTSALSKQIRDAEENWDRDREDQVEALKALLDTDPAEAVRLLKRTSQGGFYLVGRWEHLDGRLKAAGRWTGPERDEAIRLLGHDPAADKLQGCPEAWLTRFLNLTCQKNPAEGAVRWLIDRVPDAFRATYSAEVLPDPASALKRLRAMVADQVVPLVDACERLSAERDDPDRQEARDRAHIVQDAPSARLLLRYHAEARTSFHKAYSELIKTLERDKAAQTELIPASASASPNEPSTPAEPAAESPNEPGDPEPEVWAPPFEPGPPVSEADVALLAAALRREPVPVMTATP